MLELNAENVVESTQTGNFLLIFYTEWCPLCSPIINILGRLEQQNSTDTQFAKVNFDTYPKAVEYYGVPGVPTVLAIKNGIVLSGWVGLACENSYKKIVSEIFE